MKRIIISAVAVIATIALGDNWNVTSPDGKNSIKLDANGKSMTIQVFRNGKAMLAPSEIGMRIAGHPAFGPGAKSIGQKARAINETIATPIYKKSQIVNRANENTISFAGGFAVTLHAADDGVAYRFETALKDKKVKVLHEKFDLTFNSPETEVYTAYEWGHQPDPLQNAWESIYFARKVKNICSGADSKHITYLPMTMVGKDGVMVITESDLRDYAGMNFDHASANPATLSSRMAKASVRKEEKCDGRYSRVTKREGYLVETDGTRTYPWRVFMLADKVEKLLENDRVYALAAPSRIADTSWIKPGMVQWDWWNDWNISGVNFRAGCNTETYKHYIDFAAKYKIPYVILDEGWAENLNIYRIRKEVDVKQLIAYGKERGVGIVLWCAWSQLIDREEDACKMFARLGAVGLKIDFMDRDDAYVVNFLEKVAEIAAKYRMLVDYHGMFKPTGMSRTYPNIINYEGVHGLEQLKWERDSDFPRNDCVLTFTRMAAGPMDYTPGAMINCTKADFKAVFGNPRSQGTRAHQMALMALFESPLQMLCDNPTHYRQNDECFRFMAATPTVWDETIGLESTMEKNAAVARRKGDVWYISVIGNWNAQKLSFKLPFLPQKFNAEIFRDGINADRNAEDYVHENRMMTNRDTLKVELAPGGGFVARITPER